MSREGELRAACLRAIHRFCDAERLPLPPHLVERDEGEVLRFVGTASDGRQYAIGYERSAQA